MKKTGASIILLLLILGFISVNAAEQGNLNESIVRSGDKARVSFSINGNAAKSTSAGVSSSFGFNPNVGLDISWKYFGFGIDASTFSTKSDFDFDTYSTPLKTLDYLSTSYVTNNWRSTSILLGPSFILPFGSSPVSLTLSVKGGMSFNQTPDFSIVETSTSKNIAITNADNYKKKILTFKPSLAFRYCISDNLAVNANVQYSMQNGQGEFVTGYSDLSNVEFGSPKTDIIRRQISTARSIKNSSNGPDKYMSAGVGITYRFGRKGWDGTVKGGSKGIQENGIKKNDIEEPKNPMTGKGITENGIKKNDIEEPKNPMAGKGITQSGIKKNDIEEPKNPMAGKGITENGIKKNDLEEPKTPMAGKGITESGIKKNDLEEPKNPMTSKGITQSGITDLEHKAIAETLVNMRKDWDGYTKQQKNNTATKTEVKAIAETLVNMIRKGWDGTVKGGSYVSKEADIALVSETLVNIRKGWDGTVKGGSLVSNDADVKAISETLVNLRKGWDGTVKGGSKGIQENGIKKNDIEEPKNPMAGKGITENGIKKNDIEEPKTPMAGKGITQSGIKKNDLEEPKNPMTSKGITQSGITDLERKAIAETLVNMRKDWDGSTKQQKNNTATKTEVKAIAETLVNMIRKGWDGTVKGGSYVSKEADIAVVSETLVNIRKGWDGTVKGGSLVSNDADVKAISETLVNLRKGWDGTVKGGSKGIQENGIKKNATAMNVPKTGKGITENGLKVSIMGTGQTRPDGTPIVYGKIVKGSLLVDKTVNKPAKYAFVKVSIKQTESGDIGDTVTDEQGNFSIVLAHDTLHTIYLNAIEYGKIKLAEPF